MSTGIAFAGNSLQTTKIITSDIDHTSVPIKDLKVYALAHGNASKVPFSSYPSRSVKVTGMLIGDNIADLDDLLDTFKSYLAGTEQNLDIDYSGGTRRYIATVNSTAITRPGNLAYAKFEIEFICSRPFGYDIVNTTALSATGRTSATYTDSYTFLGTAPYQLPIVTITLTAVTGGTAKYIQWGNGSNGQAISVLRDWTAGDVLVIDCVNKIVTVNGTEVAFTGAFPEFPPGARSMQYTDSFTTRTFSISALYTRGNL